MNQGIALTIEAVKDEIAYLSQLFLFVDLICGYIDFVKFLGFIQKLLTSFPKVIS